MNITYQNERELQNTRYKNFKCFNYYKPFARNSHTVNKLIKKRMVLITTVYIF